MGSITIEVNNHKSRLHGEQKLLIKIQNNFKVREPNAFWIRKGGNVQEGWDGKVNYVTDAWYFKTGLLEDIILFTEEKLKKKVKLVDHRIDFEVTPKVPKMVGNLKPRPYQSAAIESIVSNKVKGLTVPIGVLDMATNAGKTMIAAGIYLAYKRKIPALVIINDADLFEQFKKEIPELVGKDAGFVRGKEQNWNNFTVCMAPTLSRNIKTHKYQLAKYGIVLVDEADLADNTTYRNILINCQNAKVRCGMSGTIYMSKLAKHKKKNMNLKSYFGPVKYKISKLEMVEKGHSTNIIVKLFPGSNLPNLTKFYGDEYTKCIVYNEDRNSLILERVSWNLKLKKTPIVIICRLHDHVDLLYQMIKNKHGKDYSIDYVYGGRKNRKEIISSFREGHTDVLIASLILTRGKNFPLLRVLINAAAGDSQERVSQLMGRLERKSDTKKNAIMEDFFDEGRYFKRHSKHRLIYYKKERFKVITKY